MAQIVFASLLTSRLKPKVDWVVIYVVSSVCCSWLTEVCGAHDESSRRNRAQRDSSTRRNVRRTLLGLHAVAFFLETITHISNPVPFLLCFAFIILQEKIGLPLLVWKCLHRTGPYEDRDNLALQFIGFLRSVKSPWLVVSPGSTLRRATLWPWFASSPTYFFHFILMSAMAWIATCSVTHLTLHSQRRRH